MGTIRFYPRKKENPPICLERPLKPGFLPSCAEQHCFLVGSKLATVEKLRAFCVQQEDVGAARWAPLLESPRTAAEGRLTATTGAGKCGLCPALVYPPPSGRLCESTSWTQEEEHREQWPGSRGSGAQHRAGPQPLVAVRCYTGLPLWAERGGSSPSF